MHSGEMIREIERLAELAKPGSYAYHVLHLARLTMGLEVRQRLLEEKILGRRLSSVDVRSAELPLDGG